jgi:hypothetical protein
MQVPIEKLIERISREALRLQDLSIVNREQYIALALSHVKALGALDLLRLLKESGATIDVPEEQLAKLGLEAKDVGA